MNWIFQSIVGLILDLVSSCLTVISKEFYEVLKLNDGATLDVFFNLFMPNVKSGGLNAWSLCVALGMLILYFNLILNLFKAFFGPLVKAESPLKLVAKFLFFAILVAYSKDICVFFFEVGTAPYNLLKTMSFNGVPDIGAALKTFATTEFISKFSITGPFAEIIKSIFTVFILFSILVNYLKLIIEVAERYVILGILSIVSPMCIATGASESTANIAKSWVRMMVSQVIVMCMSVFFLRVFEGAVHRISLTGASPFLTMVLILAWLRTGQRIDSHMGTLGLTVAQAGNGLYGDMMAGAAVAKSVGRKASGAVTTATGAKAAGGLGAYMASQEGKQRFGAGANRLARAAQSAGGSVGAQSKINTAKFDAMNSGIGVNRSQSAISGIQAKYGDAKSANNPDGKSLNELLQEGGAIKSAAMTADGSGEATVVDKNGNELTMAFGTDKDGNPTVGLQGNDEALSNASNAEKAGEIDTDAVMAAVGGEEMATSDLNANGECVPDEDGNIVAGSVDPDDLSGIQTDGGQDVTGLADENGMVAAGTEVKDKDGNTIGITDGEGNMMTDGQYATDANGDFQDVTGIAGINDAGQAIDAEGNIMTDANGDAIQMADVGAEGSVGVDENGNFVDANGNVVGDAAATSDIAMAADGSVFAKGEDGQYHAMQDSEGNAVQLDSGQSLSVGSDGQISGIADANGNALTDSNNNAIGISDTLQDGTSIAGGALTAAESISAGGGDMALNDAGEMVGISNSLDANGQISADAVTPNNNGSGGFITADDGSQVSVSGNATDGYSVTGGTFAAANGHIDTNSTNGNGTSQTASIENGSIVGGVSASLGSNVSTFNRNESGNSVGESYAMTSGGMVALGNTVDSNGHITASGAGVNGSNIQSNGQGGLSMNVNGSQVAVKADSSSPSGYSIAGHTYSKAEGNTGQFVVGASASGGAMLVSTNGNGGINRYNQTQSGQLSLSGSSSAISHSYGSASGGSGGFVKDGNNNYQQIYSGAGGKTDSGTPQLYKRNSDGGYSAISSRNELGAGESAFVRTSANNSQGFNYSNVGAKEDLPKGGSCQTYNQTGSYYNGIAVSKNNDGSYGIQLSKGATAESYGNGKISLNTGNGGSVLLKDTAMYRPPSENAMVAEFGGKSYYVQPQNSAAVGNVGGQNAREIKNNAQNLVNSCSDGSVRDYFQGKQKIGEGKYRSYAAAEKVTVRDDGSFHISSSIPASKDANGKTTATKGMTFFPADKFNSNNPSAKKASFKGQEGYVVYTRDKVGGEPEVPKNAGISKNKEVPNHREMNSMELNRNLSYVNRGPAAAKSARQRKIDEMDRMEGRR